MATEAILSPAEPPCCGRLFVRLFLDTSKAVVQAPPFPAHRGAYTSRPPSPTPTYHTVNQYEDHPPSPSPTYYTVERQLTNRTPSAAPTALHSKPLIAPHSERAKLSMSARDCSERSAFRARKRPTSVYREGRTSTPKIFVGGPYRIMQFGLYIERHGESVSLEGNRKRPRILAGGK